MTIKWLNKRSALILAALILVTPVSHSMASIFDTQSVVDLINKDRVSRNIAPLVVNEQLTQAAKAKADDMIAHNYFAHVSPTGVTPWQWIEKSGYDYVYAGENLAINFSDAKSQQGALMNSPTHKKNILNEKYKEIGVAVVSKMIDGKESILTVQEFGTSSTTLKTNSAIAGLSVTKATADSMNIRQDNFIDINAVEKIPSIILKNISPIPFVTFLCIVVLVIAITLLVYELTHSHERFASHWLTARRKRKINLLDPEDQDDE